MKEVSMVASAQYNISLTTASNKSQTIAVSNNLLLFSSTPIKTNIDMKNP